MAKRVDFLVLIYSYLYADHVTRLWMLVDIVLCAFFAFPCFSVIFGLSVNWLQINGFSRGKNIWFRGLMICEKIELGQNDKGVGRSKVQCNKVLVRARITHASRSDAKHPNGPDTLITTWR